MPFNFQQFSVISGQWEGNNERLCVMEHGSIAHNLS